VQACTSSCCLDNLHLKLLSCDCERSHHNAHCARGVQPVWCHACISMGLVCVDTMTQDVWIPSPLYAVDWELVAAFLLLTSKQHGGWPFCACSRTSFQHCCLSPPWHGAPSDHTYRSFSVLFTNQVGFSFEMTC
jgi:hypothetical protein